MNDFMNSNMYCDTAAISESAKFEDDCSGASLLETLGRLVQLPHCCVDWELFFGRNTTDVFLTIVEGLSTSSGIFQGARRILLCEPSHPVVLSGALAISKMIHVPVCQIPENSIDNERLTEEDVVVIPATCWITGRLLYMPEHIRALKLKYRKTMILVDAAQTLGNNPRDFMTMLMRDSMADVLIGGLHKWLGCSHPVGVAWIKSSFLEERVGLIDWLALKDYLGKGAGARHILTEFRDTYNGRLGHLVAAELNARFPDEVSIARHHQILKDNANFLRKEMKTLKDCVLLNDPCSPDSMSAIVCVQGPSEILQVLSQSLATSGYNHSICKDERLFSKHPGNSIIRLSAPTKLMSQEDQRLFDSIVTPFRGIV